jgi:hypothetical protein
MCSIRVKLCTICKRVLDQPTDPFSLDCGGDCLWCIKDAEKAFIHVH